MSAAENLVSIFWISAYLALFIMYLRGEIRVGRRFGNQYGMPFPTFLQKQKMPREVREAYNRATLPWAFGYFPLTLLWWAYKWWHHTT